MARDSGGVGVLTGGRLTVTDAYAYAKFARLALRTNDIDFRARAHSAEEAQFLASRVAGGTPDSTGVSFAALESAPAVLLVAFEPEEESASLFLRLRKASRAGVPVFSVAALVSRGLAKMHGELIGAVPGEEPAVLRGLASESTAGAGLPDAAARNRAGALLRAAGAVILVGERAAQVPGLLTAVGALVDATGAALAWVPRRAGERGALDAGALGTLLPGGRPIGDAAARAEVEAAWGASIPDVAGRDTAGILAAVGIAEPDAEADTEADTAADTGTDVETASGTGELVEAAEPGLAGLLIGGVEISDLPDPAAALAAVASAGFVVSLEIRRSAVTELADVVFPVAAAAEKAGAYVNWEGRPRPFAAALPDAGRLDDARVLDTLGVEMDVDLYTQTPAAAAAELGRLGVWSGDRPDAPTVGALPALRVPDGLALTSWRMNLDGGRAMDGEPHLAATARHDVARLSGTEAARRGLADGDIVAVRGPASTITLPLAVSTMVDGAVWLPAHIGGVGTAGRLGAVVGDGLQVEPAARARRSSR